MLSCKKKDNEAATTLLVAAASNVQFVLEEVLADFEKNYGIKCEAIVSSSGKLSSQIIAGANFDVFISADQSYPKYIFDQGLGEGEPQLYAKGKLVYWSTVNDLEQSKFDLSDERFHKIAIANPKLAPYGRAAEEALEAAGIKDLLADRFVYGENISQVNQFISLGVADIGITSQSILYASKGGEKGTWIEVQDSLYEPIMQDAILLRNGKSSSANRKLFMNFLLGEKGQSILSQYGYGRVVR